MPAIRSIRLQRRRSVAPTRSLVQRVGPTESAPKDRSGQFEFGARLSLLGPTREGSAVHSLAAANVGTA
jgi:hypothetical protein